MGKIIAFSGKAGSGKTTSSEHLRDMVGRDSSHIVSFAKSLKAKALEEFGEFIGDSIEKDKIVTISGRTMTVRQILIELGRLYRTIDENFWVRGACKKVMSFLGTGHTVMIDDVRYPNEYDTLKSMGAILVRIERPGIPLICDESELALDNHSFDATIANDGVIDDLRAKLDALAAAYGLYPKNEVREQSGSVKILDRST